MSSSAADLANEYERFLIKLILINAFVFLVVKSTKFQRVLKESVLRLNRFFVVFWGCVRFRM